MSYPEPRYDGTTGELSAVITDHATTTEALFTNRSTTCP